MKSKHIITALLLSAFAVNSAMADVNDTQSNKARPYGVGVSIGWAWANDFPSSKANPRVASDRGFALTANITREIKKRFMLQGVFNFSDYNVKKPFDNGHLQSFDLIGNAYLTLFSMRSNSPYVAAGVGVSRTRLTAGGTKKQPQELTDTSEYNFTYQFGTGLKEQLNQYFTAYLQYWYTITNTSLKLEKIERSGSLKEQTVSIGLNYQFHF